MVMFKQSYASETVKPYHNVLSCAQNEENPISNNFLSSLRTKLKTHFRLHFTTWLTDFWAIVYEYGVDCPFGCFCSG